MAITVFCQLYTTRIMISSGNCRLILEVRIASAFNYQSDSVIEEKLITRDMCLLTIHFNFISVDSN